MNFPQALGRLPRSVAARAAVGFSRLAALGLLAALPLSGQAGGVVATPTLAAFNAALAGGGTVTFSCSGTITVTNPVSITANTVIDATGQSIILSGASASQIFMVSNGVSLGLNSLIINDGFTTTNGGAIYNRGTLNATNCAFVANYAVGATGTNAVAAGASGQAGGSGRGGAIYNIGTASLYVCKFQLNIAAGGSGGYAQTGATTGTGVGGPGGTGGAGGFGYGGAIFSSNSIAMSDCNFIANDVVGGSGGAGGTAGYGPSGYGTPGTGGVGGDADGAALCTFLSSTVIRSTFTSGVTVAGSSGASGNGYNTAPNGPNGGNGCGGGIYNAGTNAIINCTFFANTNYSGAGGNSGAAYTGPNGGNGGVAEGGGIYSLSLVGVTNCTLSTNVLIGGAGGTAYYYTGGTLGTAGSTGIAKGGALGNNGGTFTLKNSILAYSHDTGGTGSAGNGAGTITDAGNNLSSDSSITLGGSGSHVSTDPLLAVLSNNNGGYTATCALASNSPAINVGDNNAAPPTDQRGYLRAGISDIGSYEYNGGQVFIAALGGTASLDGNVGLFLVGGPTQAQTNAITVNFTTSGNASNGVDYVYITNTAVIPAGSLNTRVLVNGIPGAFSGTNKSVTLVPLSSTNFIVSSGYADPDEDTVYIFDHNTYSGTARYVRGTSTAPDFQSLVVPIGLESGVVLSASGGNAANLFPGNQWTNTLYHFNATNLLAQTNITGRIPFQNPIVAFGDPVGGSSLYLNQNYPFGIASGTPYNLTNALQIEVYYRSNSALAGTIALPLPNVANAGQLLNLVTNGFTQTYSGFGLQTTLLVPSYADWGLQAGQNYILTHTASAVATNYYYEIDEQGTAYGNNLVLNQSNAVAWSKLYVMEFSPYPVNLSTFIGRPHFDGVPMPSIYEGLSLAELTNVQATLPNLSFLNPSNYLTVDDSPELRRHPILDQFVQNMGNDPLVLANYVINQIGLVDGVDYNTNYTCQTTVNLGGVNRSALDTYQEGQGSPMEQCALLVYLLRQAGVPAAYVFPTNGGLQMLSSQMSKLLQVQLTGAVNLLGQTNAATLLNVNYPWVAAYVGTNWVQIFPWLKDTEITEGFNLYDYMPTNYNSGYKWLTHFVAGDTNIFSLSSSDQPLVLLPLFIQNSLNQNYPGMAVSDLGMQIVNRQHLYSQWSDLPLPFALSGTPTVIESLSTNLALFNTLEVQVYSQANPSKLIDTTEMYLADLQNRNLLLKFQQVGTNNVHNMILSLEPYSTSYTNVTAFGTGANSCWNLASTNQLNSTDDNIVFQITHRRSKLSPATGGNLVTNQLSYIYYERGQQTAGQVFQQTDTFRKGDLVAFCFDSGRVTPNMLNVHAQEIWNYNQTANTNVPATLNPDIYLGQTTYLMGMSYFNYCSQFRQMADALHKITLVSWYDAGYGLLRPQRDSSGNLINGGQVNPITPAVHMPDNGEATIYNGSTMANNGRDYLSSTLDWWLQIGVQASAAEHGVLRSFYVTNAISTIKLLQQVSNNVVVLTADNYVTAGQTAYHGVPLMNADTNLWATVTGFFATNNTINSEVLITPGIVTNGTYAGVGALIFSDNVVGALVGGLNGGYASSFPYIVFTPGYSPYLTVDPAPDDSISPYYMTTAPDTGNPAYLVNGAVTSWDLVNSYDAIASGQEQLDPSLAQTFASLAQEYGVQSTPASDYNQLYDTGTVSTETATYNDPTQRAADPVNMMTGEFYIDAPDLTLPGPMPLQIRRNYGSQNLAENEFGFGWRISDMPFLSVCTNGLIYAVEMDGTTVAYRQTTANTNLWLPRPADNPNLDNNGSMGVGSTGNLFNNRLQLAVVNGANTYTLTGANGSIRTFVQQSFPIQTITRQRPYLSQWQDSRGNFYTFQFGTNSTQPDYGEVNRIQSSNGNFVGFYYDVYGHILQAYTGDGRWLQYVYDQYGDLVNVTLPDQMQISYLYQHANAVTNGVTNVYSTHLIIEEDKPDGRVLQNQYDSQRRVTNQLSTAGVSLTPIRTTTFVYTNNFNLNSPTNLLTGVTIISDYFNHATTYYYTNSLVRLTVDPLNQTVTQTWYETNTPGGFQRSPKTHTDKRGLQMAYLYDVFGNLTNTIATGDLTGNGIATQTATNTAVYNPNNLPVQITDPAGNSTVVVYDPVFNFLPQQTIRYAGATPVSTNRMLYTDVTNVVVDGYVTRTNVAFGLLTRQIRACNSPDAATNDAFYNGEGYVTNNVEYTGTGDPNVSNQLFFDERGEMVQSVDAAGATHVFAYDPMGRKTAQETYDVGQTVPMDFAYWYYNDNGELNWIDGPRYNPEDYVFYDYDGAGRRTTEIHWRSQANSPGTGVAAPAGNNLYAQTFYQYDPLGDLVLRLDPRGAVTTNRYDALCRLTQSTHLDTNGVTVLSVDGFGYEPGGAVQAHTNALGGVTTTHYTAAGKPESRSNADGSTNGWRYYLDGRIYREIQSNGAYWQTTYDDVNRLTTRTFYSAAGVAEAANSAQFDRRGNVIQKVDEGGNVFTTAYDGLDRAKMVAGPVITTVSQIYLSGPAYPPTNVTNVLCQSSTNLYDAAGRVLTNINAAGETTVTRMDALGRVTTNLIYSATGVLVREHYTAYSADHNSVTVTDGSGAGAISHTTWTDTDGRPVLAIANPATGVTEFTQNQYDLAGNLVSAQHNSSAGGTVTTWTTATFAYDGLNRPVSKVDRDGALTTYAYDALGDLINRTLTNSVQLLATNNRAGQKLQDWIVGGGSGTRTNTYTYFPVGSPFAGLLQTKVDGRFTTNTYAYDDWLRVTNQAATGALPEQNLTTAWQFEPRGYITGITEQYASTNTGPATTVQRTFDPYGQLATEAVNDGTFAYGAGQSWDATGRRTTLTVGGANYGYAWQADGSLIYASNPTASGSYGYDTTGLLTNRLVYGRDTAITARDGEGRPLAVVNKVNSATQLSETLAWSGDGLLTNHTLVRGDFTDNRLYSYGNLSRRLTQEQLNLNAGTTWTNEFAYDRGVAGGPGALTTLGPTNASFGLWWSGLPDAFSRINAETNNAVGLLAYGYVNGQSTLSASLDNQSIQILDVGTNNMQWRTFLELAPGPHQLTVNALHPSGFYTASATNAFTNNIPNQVTSDSFDGGGNITNRVFRNASGATNRTQSLSYDARGRLRQVIELNTNNYGFLWQATYDALNRRLATTTILISNGVPSTVPPQVLNSYFDPQVEFLELGVLLNAAPAQEFLQPGTSPTIQMVWKLYGPDLNGTYGGENGTGGFEGTSSYLNSFVPNLCDARGNVLAEVTNGVVSWTLARPTGFGAVPGHRPVAYGNGVDFAKSSVWRGHEVDVTGYYHIGMRDYDPVSGQWLSYDPAWNDRDPNGQSFCGGDPINGFDADGRTTKTDYQSAGTLAEQFNAYEDANGANSGDIDNLYNSSAAFRAQVASQLGPQQNIYGQADPNGPMSDLPESVRLSMIEQICGGTFQQESYNYTPATTVTPSQVLDMALNTQQVNDAASEWDNADWDSGWGVTMKVASGISYAANTVDGVANLIPLVGTGKMVLEDGVKTLVKEGANLIGEDAAKNEINIAKSEIPTINGRKPINSDYAGQPHPSGVVFKDNGFPDFSPYAVKQVEIQGLTGEYDIDAQLANEALGYPSTPKGYVWHHVEDGTTMQLIPQDVHQAARHTGGAAVIRNGGIDQ